jgi:inosine triphosphate pyrophosphatase
VGYDGLNKMLEGFEDKTAYSQTIFAYQATPEAEPILFIGRCHVKRLMKSKLIMLKGKIVPPRGEKFGWPIFQPDGFEQTFAELDRDVKNSISQRGRALQQMVKYFEETK